MTLLQDHQTRFLQLTLDLGALKLGGAYKLKSGRISPYFFNAGLFNTGTALLGIGEAFADAIVAAGIEFDMLFGPAYKGIPLVAAVAIAFASKYNRSVPYAFNRKEAKDHGEGGIIVGSALKGKILLIDDVITAGTAIRESVCLLNEFANDCKLTAVAVALDRQEKAAGSELSAIQSVEKDLGVQVVSIANLDAILAFTKDETISTQLAAYRDIYMKYISTRDSCPAKEYSFLDVVIEGLAADGGLFVPKSVPEISPSEWTAWKTLSYTQVCFQVLRKFICALEIGDSDLQTMINSAYKSFRIPEVIKLVQLEPELHLMELFHGPTFAFKDVALQLLGHFFDFALKKKNTRMTILGATSGDTGSAAIAGVKGRANIDCVILFPLGKTSAIQEAQMTSNLDPNIHCLAVTNSVFDDCQSIVKTCFNDAAFNHEMKLGAVNSINWARILAQIVYYVYAALQLGNENVSFVVPTGNFGDILAGYYAKRMHVPMGPLVIASNQNDILPRFFRSGEYKINGPVVPSLSPSMDIAVSSNFERFLFDLLGRNGARIVEKFNELNSANKSFKISPDELLEAKKFFVAFAVSERETIDTIHSVYKHHEQYLLCPHSAVAYCAALKYRASSNRSTLLVSLATAHMGKFTEDVLKQLPAEDRELRQSILDSVPAELKQLVTAKTRRVDIENSAEAVKEYLRKHL